MENTTTPDEKERIRTIIQKLITNDTVWFNEKNITFSKKSGYWILNYREGDRNEYNSLVRGMVVRVPQVTPPDLLSLVTSFPFSRFFNSGEKDAAPVNFGNAEMLEKLDGCLSKDTKISFCDGSEVRIKDVVEQKLVGPVWGYDFNTKQVIPTKITCWHNNGVGDNWVTVSVKDVNNGNGKRVIHATTNHLFYDPSVNEYVQAGCLSPPAVVYRLRRCLINEARSMVFGTMLGDCNLSYPGWKLAWCHSDEQRALTDWYCKVLGLPFSIDENRRGGYPGSKSQHRYFIFDSELLEEVGDICLDNGKKKISTRWLECLDEVSLATWYMDDGSISYGKKLQRPRALLHTEGFYESEVEQLLLILKTKFNISGVKQKYRGYTCVRLNADAAEVFWQMIAQYIIPEMRYKLPDHLRECDVYWDKYIVKSVGMRVKEVKVLSVLPGNYHAYKKKFTTKYDITTDTSNFFANGVLVHNSLLGVFFPDKNISNPQWHTRKMLSTHEDDVQRSLTSFGGKNFKFMQVIGQYVKNLHFQPGDESNTFIFEFIHEASYVLTKYAEPAFGLYLIGLRNLVTHEEASESELDQIAKRIGVKRPRRWNSIADKDEIIKMMKEIGQQTKDFEGFVFRDKDTGKRVKVKDADYVRKHHLIDDGRSIKKLLPKILMGEEDEIVTYFPHLADRIKEIKTAYEDYLNKAVAKVEYWLNQGLGNKELAIKMFGKGEKDRFIRDSAIRLSRVPQNNIKSFIDTSMRKIALGDGKNAGNPLVLMGLIGLREEQ